MLVVLAVLALAGCGERSRASGPPAPSGPGDRAAARAAPTDTAGVPAAVSRAARPPPPLFHGAPLWADNRRGGAEDNARYQFAHRGADIGATSFEDYLTRVHAFFDHPPPDAETATRASNGDRLVYSPSANLFGVQRRDGAPRLLMRPATGRAYWEAQRNPPAQPILSDQMAR